MPIPRSMIEAGYLTPEQVVSKRRIMIGTEGETNTGKSEFAFSFPGPIAGLCLDKNIDGALMNPVSPRAIAKRTDIGIKTISAPMAGQTFDRAIFLESWVNYYAEYTKILDNPDVITVLQDGDSDSWELQRLAAFGTLTQIPSIMYDTVNAARRLMITRAYNSKKNIISTNKITSIYKDMTDAEGNVVMGNNGKAKQIKSEEFRRQGFSDYDYIYQIQLRHLFRPARKDAKGRDIPMEWGIRLLRCKPNRALEGTELWGEDCCFDGLVSYVFPHIALEEWYAK